MALCPRIAEGARAACREEGFAGCRLDQVGAGVAIAHVAAYFEAARLFLLLAVFPTEVHTCLLLGNQSLRRGEATGTTEATRTDIVGRSEEGDAALVGEAIHEELAGIAFLRTIRQVGIRYPRFVELTLRRDVEHGGFLAVVNACQFGIVAGLVVSLDAVHHFNGQVLHGHLGVALEEVFAVDEEFLDLLAVPGDFAVIAHLHAGQLLHECFER